MNKRKADDECEGNKSKEPRQDDENVLKLKLKNFMTENRFDKQHVFHYDFIDDFHKLATRHITSVSNSFDWRLIGKFLEVATKIFEMRVDALYSDCVNSSNSLKLSKPQEQNNVSNLAKNETTVGKKLIVKRKSSRVAGNPQILNARLDVHKIPNPAFAMVASQVEVRSKNMLTNILSTKESAFVMPGDNKKFWDSRSPEETVSNNYLACVNYEEASGNIRTSLENYRIKSTPLENHFAIITIDLTRDEDVEMVDKKASSTFDSGHGQLIDDMEFQHDEDVEMVENVKTQATNRTFDSGFLEQSQTIEDMEVQYDNELRHEEINQDEQDQSNILMPTTTETFEYSYQSQEMIKNHWAGPSYWKFCQKSVCESKASKRTLKKHKSEGFIHVEEVLRKRFKEDDLFDASQQSNQSRTTIYRSQTLPMDFSVSPEVVDRYEILKHLDIAAPITNEVKNSQYNDNDYDDQTYFEEATQMCDITTQDTIEVPHLSLNQIDNNDTLEDPSFDDILESTRINENFSSLSMDMNFTPKTASSCFQIYKPTNIKAIKDINLAVLESEKCMEGCNKIKFSELSKKSAKMMEGMKSSCALIFQGILHQANDEKVEIESKFGDIDDFYVRLK